MQNFLQSRYWVIGRRLVLVAIIIVLGYRSYGGRIGDWFASPDPTRDIEIRRADFRSGDEKVRPAWIIDMKNHSGRHTYDQILFEATYFDTDGKVIETDRIVVHQKLVPGDEQMIGSVDAKARPLAKRGALKVLDAKKLD